MLALISQTIFTFFLFNYHTLGADHPNPATNAPAGAAPAGAALAGAAPAGAGVDPHHITLPHTQPHQQPRYIAVDPAAAAQSYAVASQRGKRPAHTLTIILNLL